MKVNESLMIEKIFKLDFEQEVIDLAKKTASKIPEESEILIDKITKKQKTVINFSVTDKEIYSLKNEVEKSMALFIAAGLPTEHFAKAEEEYRKEIADYDSEYILEGHLLGGCLAQYAAIMSEDCIQNYKVVTYNSLGIKSFTKFSGNEFLGYKRGLLYYLDDLINKNGNSNSILYALIDKGVIKYDNISGEYRVGFNDELNVDRMKQVLIEIFNEQLNLEKEEAKELVEENFNPQVVESKMRFIDKYHKYQKSKQEKIKNYLLSDNLAAQAFTQLCPTYVVDNGLMKKDDNLEQNIVDLVKSLKTEQIEQLIESSPELFEPYTLLEAEGNGRETVNKSGNRAEIGEITSHLSKDYLRALVKDIVLDLQDTDETILTEIFKRQQRNGSKELIKLIKDRLQHSMYLRGLKEEEELDYQSRLLEEKPELFAELEKSYRLDRAVIEQLEERMSYFELKNLCQWKLSGEGIFIILGSDVEGDDIIEYHSSTQAFDNSREEIAIELEEASRNKIYGSLKKSANYKEESDKHYHHQEDEAYNFSSQQGVGFFIVDDQVDPQKSVKVDGADISGVYAEIEREEAELGEREISTRDKYFGEDIILRDYKKSYGELSGKLIYLYGEDKADELIIDGFKNGDYGIELEAKPDEEGEEEPITYTPYGLKFANFEFIDLEEFELKKEIYQHTRLKVAGLISEDRADEYLAYLAEDDPQVVITYLDDETKILFKGIIEEYKLIHKNRDYYLQFVALSYSRLLERSRVNRIYQNEGTTYGDLFGILEEDNEEFNIKFDDDALEEQELVDEEHPVVLQYGENDWDFLRRVISYSEQILIVDDTKDDEEAINILAGKHDAPARELNNRIANLVWQQDKFGLEELYYQIKGFHYPDYQLVDEEYQKPIFELGIVLDYKIQEEETEELLVIANRIYIAKGQLYSDLKLVKEDEINIKKRRRQKEIAGKSFRAEIKDTTEENRAQVEFLDLEDDFNAGDTYYYPLDKSYTGSYFSPEEGDIVAVYFKSEAEKSATIKSSSSDKEEIIDHDPQDKVIITPEGYQIKLNNEEIILHDKSEESIVKLTDSGIINSYGDNQVKVDDEGINLETQEAEMKLSSEIKIEFDGREIEISSSGIDFD